jgi:hypothetical protein
MASQSIALPGFGGSTMNWAPRFFSTMRWVVSTPQRGQSLQHLNPFSRKRHSMLSVGSLVFSLRQQLKEPAEQFSMGTAAMDG